MPHYAQAAEFHDLLYADQKDYPAEARLIASLVRNLNPRATRLLDVGCGTANSACSPRHGTEHAFREAGLEVERRPEVLRGLYIGRQAR